MGQKSAAPSPASPVVVPLAATFRPLMVVATIVRGATARAEQVHAASCWPARPQILYGVLFIGHRLADPPGEVVSPYHTARGAVRAEEKAVLAVCDP